MLNPQQENFYNTVVSDVDGTRFFLTGSAGTGKTFTISQIAKFFVGFERKVRVLSPTHRAKKVLMDNFDSALLISPFLSFSTVHKALGAYGIANEFYETSFTTGSSLKEADWDLLIVDEVSMISQKMIENILGFTGTIIFTGDYNQLNPVKSGTNELRELEGLITVELTQQMRNTTDIETIANKAKNDVLPYYPNSEITTRDELIERFLKDDLENSVYLCFTNDLANDVSELVRQELYGVDAPDFVPGERILVRNQLVTLTEVIKIDSLAYRVHTDEGKSYTVLAPKEFRKLKKELEEIKKEVSELRKNGFYEQATELIEIHFSVMADLTEVNYPYATTIHKAQGSTFENVYVDTWDIAYKASNKKRLTFVAYSRARSNLYTIDVPKDRKKAIDMIINEVKAQTGKHIVKKRDRVNWSASKLVVHIRKSIKDDSYEFSPTVNNLLEYLN